MKRIKKIGELNEEFLFKTKEEDVVVKTSVATLNFGDYEAQFLKVETVSGNVYYSKLTNEEDYKDSSDYDNNL